jgi:hypothetical protein
VKSQLADVHINVVNHASEYNFTVTFCTQFESVNTHVVKLSVVFVFDSNVGADKLVDASTITIGSAFVFTINIGVVLVFHVHVTPFFASHSVTA